MFPGPVEEAVRGAEQKLTGSATLFDRRPELDRGLMGQRERGFGSAGEWGAARSHERRGGFGLETGRLDRFGLEAAGHFGGAGALGMAQRRNEIPPLMGERLMRDERRQDRQERRQEVEMQEEEPSKPLPPIWDDAIGDGSKSRRHARNFDPEALPLRKLFLSVSKNYYYFYYYYIGKAITLVQHC
jgi:hypothetical protein